MGLAPGAQGRAVGRWKLALPWGAGAGVDRGYGPLGSTGGGTQGDWQSKQRLAVQLGPPHHLDEHS